MFLTMTPVETVVASAGSDAESVRKSRIEAWKSRANDTLDAGEDPAPLSPLGERLLGARSW